MTEVQAEAEIEEYPITKIGIDSLVFDKDNPNHMSQQQMAGLAESMKRFGYLTPVVIDKNTRKIADGEHRALVYKQFGLTEIPAYVVDFTDDSERRLLRQTMNKLRGEHDKLLDSNELALLIKDDKTDVLAKLIAQDKEDIERLVLRYHPSLDYLTPQNEADLDKLIDDELKRKVPDTKLGDLYQLGEHRLVCADCTDSRSVRNLLQEDIVDLLLTDPPYGVSYASKNEFLNQADKGNHIQDAIVNDVASPFELKELLSAALKVVPFAEYNVFYIFMSGWGLHILREVLDEKDVSLTWGDYLVWIKQNHVLGRKDYNARHEFIVYGWKDKHKFYGEFGTTVLEYDKPQISDLHPTMKPLPLLGRLIRDGSQPGMNVYDPFAGSGSTLIACEQLGRKCFAVEIDPHYCDVVVKRWEGLTGKKAVKL